MNKRATMSQIATELDLSLPTVSYALSPDWRDTGIAEATRDKVVRKAVERGYRRNRIATSLQSRATKNIGILIPSLGGYYALILGDLEKVLSHYHILLGVSEYDVPKEKEILESFSDWMVDGLVVVSAGRRENLGILKRAQAEGVPIVQVDRFFDEFNTDIVEADNVGMIHLLTKHLLDVGHRKVWYLPGIHRELSSGRGKAEGYEKAMREHGLSPRVFSEPPSERSGSHPFDFGRGQMRRLLGQEKPPFGVVAHDYLVAYGALDATREAGLRCPQEVSICAPRIANENPVFKFLQPRLTAAEWSAGDMGTRAAQMLLRRLQRTVGHEEASQHVAVAAHLVMGESTASPDHSGCP